MPSKKDVKNLGNVIKLMSEQVESLQREFMHVLAGKAKIVNSVPHYPDNPQATDGIKKGVSSLIEGSLLVYLFAMWESYVPDDVNGLLAPKELQRLDAFKHVRDSVAHKHKGGRADFPPRRKAFNALYPFSGIKWDKGSDTIDLSDSSVARDCHQFMESLTKELVVQLAKKAKL